MEGFSFTNTTAGRIRPSVTGFRVPRFSLLGRPRTLSFARQHRKFLVLASKDEPKLDPWDQMELKFGRLLGEDPKLTLAKIMARKSNPDMSSLDVEKLFDNKKGKVQYNETEEVPFDVSQEVKASNSLSEMNFVKPVPKKGVKFEADNKPIASKENKQSQPVSKAVENTKGRIPNVILRKPTMFNEDDTGNDKSLRLRIKPNLSLKMGKELQKERFSDITLLKKPEPPSITRNLDERDPSGNVGAKVGDNIELYSSESAAVSTETNVDIALQQKPDLSNHNSNVDQGKESSGNHSGASSDNDVIETHSDSGKLSIETNSDRTLETGEIAISGHSVQENDSVTGLQPLERSERGTVQKSSASNEPSETKLADSSSWISIEAALLGKPERSDLSVKGTPTMSGEEMVLINPESYGNAADLDNFVATAPVKEHEDTDWTRAEDLVKTGRREEVELISSSTRGFVASFGSLIGFLPYRNLAAKWKFLAFESWLRRKGLDPSMYRKNLGIIGRYDVTSKAASLDSSSNPQIDHKVEDKITPDMKLEDLLQIYDQEKLKFLSSFVGQKINVSVVLADRKSRRLVFSIKPKEKEELVEKKRNLMAKLSVGDVVKCCVKKITYFGIFVEVEGVPALIHQTEVSWDATLDPASYFKIGQIVEAKVHQLDFSLERIFLSLKEIMPDPLMGALEAVVGDQEFLGGKLEVAQTDTEWTDVEALIRELQQFEGIQSVSKGRYFLSPGLAPTFQVYMVSMFENQYKLLARSENKVQEVIVRTSLGKEEMKSAILTCTNRVE